MDDEIFSDGIGNIAFENGVVRIDLVTITPGERAKDGGPHFTFRRRIIMPVDGFLKSLAPIQDMVKKLQEAGLIRRVPSEPAGAPADTAPTGQASPGGAKE